MQSGDWLVAIGYGACSEDIQKMSCEIVQPKQTVFSKANMSTGVASASNCKEQAEKFLELAYTDQKIADLMLYGVQKGNYQVKDGVVSNYFEALSDWRQYRKIGTLEECRAAREKQISEKPIMKQYYEDSEEKYLCCPTCGEILTDRIPADNKTFYFHCMNCGQKFDWSDSE